MSDTEVVEPKYLVGNTAVVASTRRPTAVKSRNPLALPLPKTNHDWGELAAHDPEIPLAQKAAPKHKAPEQPAGGPPGADPGAEPPPDEPLPEAPPEEEINKPPKYALLRLFDFTVKPGVSYRYRVSLVLKNPNYGEPAIYLANPEFAKQQYLQTPWLGTEQRDFRARGRPRAGQVGITGEVAAGRAGGHAWSCSIGKKTAARWPTRNFPGRSSRRSGSFAARSSISRRRFSR